MYKSADSVAEEELLQNSLTLSGLPPHEIKLKIGSPVMLFCNLHAGPGNRSCIGTWMIVVHLGKHIIEAETASGVNKVGFNPSHYINPIRNPVSFYIEEVLISHQTLLCHDNE